MDDSAAPGVSTPEHWSDVGPLSGRLQLVEQQVQAVQVGWDGELSLSPIWDLSMMGLCRFKGRDVRDLKA